MNLYIKPIAASFASGATSSTDYVDLDDTTLVAVILPNGFAGNVKFSNSVDTLNFFPVYDDAGNELTITAPASIPASGACVFVEPSKFAGLRYFKVISTSAQNAMREVKFLVRKVA